MAAAGSDVVAGPDANMPHDINLVRQKNVGLQSFKSSSCNLTQVNAPKLLEQLQRCDT